MTRTEQLIKRITSLPDEEQEQTAQFILDDLDAIDDLRKKIDIGLADIKEGRIAPFESPASFITRMKMKHGLT